MGDWERLETVANDQRFNNLCGSHESQVKSVCHFSGINTCKTGLLNLMGQFSYSGIGCKIKVKFVNSHLFVPASFDPSAFSQTNCLSVCFVYAWYGADTCSIKSYSKV